MIFLLSVPVLCETALGQDDLDDTLPVGSDTEVQPVNEQSETALGEDGGENRSGTLSVVTDKEEKPESEVKSEPVNFNTAYIQIQ